MCLQILHGMTCFPLTGKNHPVGIPQFHRMVTCYDIYIGCFEVVAEKGSTMTNQRGECVKRPEVNIMRENWAQYLEIAKQYGFTPRSSKMTPSSGNEVKDTPADQFFSER